MTTDTEIRAEQARQLLANPIFQEAFNNTREALIEQIEFTAITDKDYRNELGLSLQALAAVKTQINDQIQTAMLDSEKQI